MSKIQPFKEIGKIATAPFKAAGNIFTGKGNLGDVFNIATLFAPGGNLAKLSFNSIGGTTLGSAGQSFLGSLGLGSGGTFEKSFNKFQPQDFRNLLKTAGRFGLVGGQAGGGGQPSLPLPGSPGFAVSQAAEIDRGIRQGIGQPLSPPQPPGSGFVNETDLLRGDPRESIIERRAQPNFPITERRELARVPNERLPLGGRGGGFLGGIRRIAPHLFQPGGGGGGPTEMQLLQKALRFLDPAVQGSIIERNTSTLLRDADRFSTGFGERLAQQTGNPNLGAQIQLNARNRAVGEANEFASDVRSPGGQLGLFQQALGLTGQAVGIQGQRAQMKALEQQILFEAKRLGLDEDLVREQLRQPTFWEQVANAAQGPFIDYIERQTFGGVA